MTFRKHIAGHRGRYVMSFRPDDPFSPQTLSYALRSDPDWEETNLQYYRANDAWTARKNRFNAEHGPPAGGGETLKEQTKPAGWRAAVKRLLGREIGYEDFAPTFEEPAPRKPERQRLQLSLTRGLVESAGSEELTHLVVGRWDDWPKPPGELVSFLAANAHVLPKLRHLYFGDLGDYGLDFWSNETFLGDLSPLLGALPELESLVIRGSITQASLGAQALPNLRALELQSPLLPADVLPFVQAHPTLEELTLWLGAGGPPPDAASLGPDELLPILNRAALPHLHTLRLRSAGRANELAMALSDHPFLDGLQELDFSDGALGDDGVRALLDSPRSLNLDRLNVANHWCSDECTTRMLAKSPPFVGAERRGEWGYGWDREVHLRVGRCGYRKWQNQYD